MSYRGVMMVLALVAIGCGVKEPSGKSSGSKVQPAAPGWEPKSSTPIPPRTVVQVRPSEGMLAEQMRSAAGKAKQAGQKPFVEIGAGWCAPCQAIHKSMGDVRMSDAFSGVYLIQLDLDEWEGKLEPAGLSAKAIPVF